jgi:hypothetical protein
MAFEMMTENRVNLLLHSLFVDVVMEGNAVRGVIVENTSGRQAVLGKVIIDCTGEGHVSARAGAPYEQVPKEELEPHTISFAVDGVDWDKVLQYVKEMPEYEFNAMTHLPQLDAGRSSRESAGSETLPRSRISWDIILCETRLWPWANGIRIAASILHHAQRQRPFPGPFPALIPGRQRRSTGRP